MGQCRAGNRAVRDLIGDIRRLYGLLLLLEIANALDWATTIVGVGLIGLPEGAPTARWMIAHLGAVGGITVFKLVVGALFGALTAGMVWLGRYAWVRPHHVIAFVWLMGAATGLLMQTSLSNAAAIWAVAHGSVGR